MKWITRVVLAALLAGGAACTRYRPVTVPAPEASGWRSVSRARVTTTGSEYYVLRDVQVTADSVTGWYDAAPGGRRIALHRSEVRRFEQRGTDVVRTGLLALVAAYAVAVFVGLRGMDW